MVGQSTSAKLTRVVSYVNVTSTNEGSIASAVGGLVANGASVVITECANFGNVSSTDANSHANVGGLTGLYPSTTNTCTITKSFNAGEITGTGIVGGLVPSSAMPPME